MLFINATTSTVAAKDYFSRELSASEYYMRDAQAIRGEWHGRGAALLGLAGQVDQESYFKLCENIDPQTGSHLTPRTKTGRRILYDFTFDAPKAVSLAFEIGKDERILEVFRSSVANTMDEMENAVMTRVRTDGANETRATANMVWAEFVHRTTRPVNGVPDPHLHCHAVAFNCTYDPVENRWKAAEFSHLVQDKGYYQAAFHSRLAKGLSELGYGIARDGKSFTLVGISPELCRKFSRRTELIEAEAARLGITDAKAKGEIGRKLREGKTEGSVKALRGEWNSRVTREEHDALQGARNKPETKTLGSAKAMDFALDHCFERRSVVTDKELLKTALIQSVGNAGVEETHEELARRSLIDRNIDGHRHMTTEAVLREEIALVSFVREGRGQFAKLATDENAALDATLTDEQRYAAKVILDSRDRVTLLKGRAGTGKTRLMQATVKALEANGQRVFAFAPSAEASRGVLRAEGFTDADTLEKLCTNRALQERVTGGVLWVDEAGLMSVKDAQRLFDVAKARDCRVVLSGDTNQHAAVARGDALRLLERENVLRCAELKQVRRQQTDAYRRAVVDISHGDQLMPDGRKHLEAGIAALDRMGAIVEIDGQERYGRIAADYVAATADTPNGKAATALVVAPTHAEGARVTQAIRDGLKTAGRLSASEAAVLSLKPLNYTEAERGDRGAYRAGLAIQFHQNAKGFRRGERATVTSVNDAEVIIRRADGNHSALPLADARKFQVYEPGKIDLAVGDRIKITRNGYTAADPSGKKARLNNGALFGVAGFTRNGDIRLDNGVVLPKDYGGVAHGYAVTSHASQGKSVDSVLIALGHESLGAANREQFYVSVSRGRRAVRLYTDDKAAMLSAIQQSGVRFSASELVQGQLPPARKLRRQAELKRYRNRVRLRQVAPERQPEVPRHARG